MNSNILHDFLPTELVDIIMSSAGNLDQFIDQFVSKRTGAEIISYRNNAADSSDQIATHLFRDFEDEKKANKLVCLQFTLVRGLIVRVKAFGDDTFRIEVSVLIKGTTIIYHRIRVVDEIKVIRSRVVCDDEQDFELSNLCQFSEVTGLMTEKKINDLEYRSYCKYVPAIVSLITDIFNITAINLATECYEC